MRRSFVSSIACAMARFYESSDRSIPNWCLRGRTQCWRCHDVEAARVAAAKVSGMTALVWVIAGLATIVLTLVVWAFRLQRWSRVYRDVIEAHTRALAAQGNEHNQLRSDLLEAHIRLDRLDPL